MVARMSHTWTSEAKNKRPAWSLKHLMDVWWGPHSHSSSWRNDRNGTEQFSWWPTWLRYYETFSLTPFHWTLYNVLEAHTRMFILTISISLKVISFNRGRTSMIAANLGQPIRRDTIDLEPPNNKGETLKVIRPHSLPRAFLQDLCVNLFLLPPVLFLPSPSLPSSLSSPFAFKVGPTKLNERWGSFFSLSLITVHSLPFRSPLPLRTRWRTAL